VIYFFKPDSALSVLWRTNVRTMLYSNSFITIQVVCFLTWPFMFGCCKG
jgi:hypothetical protein